VSVVKLVRASEFEPSIGGLPKETVTERSGVEARGFESHPPAPRSDTPELC